jgi:hypothetical protein
MMKLSLGPLLDDPEVFGFHLEIAAVGTRH